MKTVITLPFAAMIALMMARAAEPSVQTTPLSNVANVARGRQIAEMKWGMFICWSFSTFSGMEWTREPHGPEFFNATGCDTDQWCRTAKEAGMGYILFLTKHHDGFCLWDTKTTDLKVTNSPLKKDVVAELRKSCDKYGIKLAFYFSEGDWPMDRKKATTAEQAELKKAQLKELLTQYGPIEYLWFDHAQGTGGLSHPDTARWCKQFQPDCLVGFNHGEKAGDIQLGEHGKPGPVGKKTGIGADHGDSGYDGYLVAEFTYPILPKGGTRSGGADWFYSLPQHDDKCLPASKLYQDYLGAVKYGNIFSIDIGPNYAGKIRDIDVKTLREVGRMIRGEIKVPPPTPHGAVPSARQLKWAKDTDLYGMVNFSTITYFSKEWGYGDEDPAKFNPTDFDACQIVRSAKAGGLKGLVIDAKHHGGFCLWPSKVNDNYSVKNSPWKNGKGDILRELVDACHAEGLKVGIYLSPWDRNHKDYGTPAYLDYYEAQLTELLTQYGPIFEVWLDGANGGDGYYGGARTTRRVDQKNYYPIRKWFELIRRHQPDALIFSDCGPDVRWNGNEHGVSGEHSDGTCWGTTHQRPWASGNTGQLNRGDRDGALYNPAEADFPLLAKAWFWNPHTRTRTPAELVNLYFTSIGRNSAMDIGIAPDTRGLMSVKDAASLKGFGDRIKAIFATNLAGDATVTASNVRGNDSTYAATHVLNGWSTGQYWASDDTVLTPELSVDFGKPTEFSIVSLREHIALGERVDDWALDSWQNGEWKEFARGTGIGMRRLWRGLPVTSNRIRLRITKAAACPAIAEIAAYLEPEAIRQECGVKTPVVLQKGIAKGKWKIVSASSEGAPSTHIIDDNPSTFWHSHTAAGPQACPQEIVVDMGQVRLLDGLFYLPRQDGCTIGNIATYSFHLSNDGKAWGQAVAQGEFGNIKVSPEQQVVKFAKPVAGRYFKFTALSSADGIPVAAAEVGVTGK